MMHGYEESGRGHLGTAVDSGKELTTSRQYDSMCLGKMLFTVERNTRTASSQRAPVPVFKLRAWGNTPKKNEGTRVTTS